MRPSPDEARVLPTPPALRAPGTTSGAARPLLPLGDLAPGGMTRVSVGDLDLLVAWVPDGIVVTDDRCPHMAAPLSLGRLSGCEVSCPLHSGRFDLCSGDVVQMPSTGGLDASGTSHPPYSPPGAEPKPEPPSIKAEARRLTRVRRMRFYPVRLVDGWIEVVLPPDNPD